VDLKRVLKERPENPRSTVVSPSPSGNPADRSAKPSLWPMDADEVMLIPLQRGIHAFSPLLSLRQRTAHNRVQLFEPRGRRG